MFKLNRLSLAAFGILLTVTAFAQPASGGGYWHGVGWGWGGMLFGSFMMLTFWGELVVLIVLAVRWLSGATPGDGSRSGQNRAREILEERFTCGKIDKEEFEERKHVLSK